MIHAYCDERLLLALRSEQEPDHHYSLGALAVVRTYYWHYNNAQRHIIKFRGAIIRWFRQRRPTLVLTLFLRRAISSQLKRFSGIHHVAHHRRHRSNEVSVSWHPLSWLLPPRICYRCGKPQRGGILEMDNIAINHCCELSARKPCNEDEISFLIGKVLFVSMNHAVIEQMQFLKHNINNEWVWYKWKPVICVFSATKDFCTLLLIDRYRIARFLIRCPTVQYISYGRIPSR